MTIILHDCRPASPIERLRDYAARVDPTTPEHRGRVIRGVRLQANFRSASTKGGITPVAAGAFFLNPPCPLDGFDDKGKALTYDDLSQGF